MTEAASETTQAPAKRKRKKRAKAAKPAAPKTASPFAGLTKSECAKGCNADGCVVSGKAYCAHPMKGGLQAGDLGNVVTTERFQQAVKHLKRLAAA